MTAPIFAALVNQTYQAIKAVNPAIVVLAGSLNLNAGTDPYSFGGGQPYLQLVYDYLNMQGIDGSDDAPYPWDGLSVNIENRVDQDPGHVASTLTMFRQTMYENNDNSKLLVVGEWGYNNLLVNNAVAAAMWEQFTAINPIPTYSGGPLDGQKMPLFDRMYFYAHYLDHEMNFGALDWTITNGIYEPAQQEAWYPALQSVWRPS